MASPPSSKPGPASPPAQESPFSSFVSSLSPINAVCVRNALHTDLGVPSPQPVFTSPHINFPRKRDLSKRFQKQAFAGAEKFPLFALNDTELPENIDISGLSCLQSMTQLIPCSQKECNKDGPSQETFSSPSTCVDEFLADPIEACDDSVAVPQIKLVDYNEAKKECKKENLRQIQLPGKLMAVSDGSQCVILGKSAIMEEDTTVFCLLNTIEGLKMDVSDNLTSSDHAEGDMLKERSSGSINHTEIKSGLKQGIEILNMRKRSHEKQLEIEVTANDDQIDPDLATDPASSPCHGLDFVGPICADHSSLMPNDKDWSRMDSGKQNHASSSVCSEAVGDVNLRHVQNEQWPDCGFTPQVLAESIPDIQENDQQDDSGAKLDTRTDDKAIHDQEDGAQHQRGMRKRLQFEGFDNHIGWKENYQSFTSAICDSESPGTSIDLDNACADSAPPPSKEQLIQLVNLSGNALCKLSLSACRRSKVDIGAQDQSYRSEGSSSLIAPTPSGIGLHLNSIGGSAPKSFNINMQCREKDLAVSIDKSVSGGHKIGLQQSNYPCSSRTISPYPSVKPISRFNNSLSYSAVENKRVDLQENQEIEPSALDVKAHDAKIGPSEDACTSKELTQMSPKKKRKKTSDNDGSKRCHCKRSKCLKLYCDCFAAGTLCSDDCACQGCFNKPEHQEKVQETRQQIETRNPLAFAPKVVLRVTEPQKDSGESKHITPTSARHKRGCNCKKSQCLKKYCECYQVGVGCSLGCRCEGCKNTFGRKDGSCEVTEMEYKFLQREMKNKKLTEADFESDSSCEKLGVKIRKGVSAAEGCISRLSPLTPLFQTSDENDVPKAQPHVSYYPSPESGSSALLSYNESPSSPKGSKDDNSLANAREDTGSLEPCDQDLNGASAAKVDPFSPRWDGFSDICDISPMSNPSPSVTGSAAITSVRERRGLQTKLFHGSGHLSAGLRWRSSPVTPLPRFGDGKFIIEPDSGSGLHCNIDDDTPDVLKDASSPAKAVTASSPNKKRVSPPAKCLHETGSSTSPAIKSGRKFILKSVPSFPPLTPYSNKR